MSPWVRAWKGMGRWGYLCLLPVLVFLWLIPEFYRSGLPQAGCAGRVSIGPMPASYRLRGEQLLINPCPACLARISELEVDGKKAAPGIHGALALPRPGKDEVTLTAETWQGESFTARIDLRLCSSSGEMT